MRRSFAIVCLALLLVPTLYAQQDCTLEWEYSLEAEQQIDGFQFEVNGIKTAKLSKKLRRAPCSRIGVTTGTYTFRLYAFKNNEYSPPSNTVQTTVELPAPRQRGQVQVEDIVPPIIQCIP